jgi:hypothetical protein
LTTFDLTFLHAFVPLHLRRDDDDAAEVITGGHHPAMTPYGARHRPPATSALRARAAARDAIRAFGQLTAPLRAAPDYLIIGTKRGGTTSVARWLLAHPGVRPLFPATRAPRSSSTVAAW